MIAPSRGPVARAARSQWRLASTISQAPRAAVKAPPTKVMSKITRPYKPYAHMSQYSLFYTY